MTPVTNKVLLSTPEVQELPSNFEEADKAYEQLITSLFMSNDAKYLKEALQTQKKILLYDLQKSRNAGCNDAIFIDIFNKGINHLKQIAANIQNDRIFFEQTTQMMNDNTRNLIHKFDQAEGSPPQWHGEVLGAVVGTGVGLTLPNLASNTVTEVLEKRIVQSRIHQSAQLETPILHKSQTLNTIQHKLEESIPKTKTRLKAAVIGGAVGLALDVLLEISDTKPAH